MKTMTCQQLGGPCDLALRGDTADEVIKAQDRHLRDAVAQGDATHQDALKGDEGPLEEPIRGHGLVQEDEAGLRRARRRLTAPLLGGRLPNRPHGPSADAPPSTVNYASRATSRVVPMASRTSA